MAGFPFFLWLDNVSFYMYYHIFLTPLIISRHLGCLTALAIMKKAAMNSFSQGLQIPFWDSHFTSLEYKPRHGIAGSHGSFIFHFSGTSVLFSIVAVLIYILNKSAPCSSQHLLSPVLLMIAILTGLKWYLFMVWFSFLQGLVISSVAQSYPTLQLCGLQHARLPRQHQLPELTQTHVHWVSDAIQSSHPLSSPSPPAFNLSQHQGLFQWVSSSHQVAKVLEFQLQHQSFQWIFRTDLL